MKRPTSRSSLALFLFVLALFLSGCGEKKVSVQVPASGWEALPLGTAAEFSSVWFTDALNGWIVGGEFRVEGGLVGRTTDGGRTWRFTSGIAGTYPGALRLGSVRFLDQRRGFVTASAGNIFATDDGGENWRPIHSGLGRANYLTGLDFIDDRHGWSVGLGGVLRTRDGGETWSALQERSSRVGGRAIRFVDEENGWLVGPHATLMSSDDGGKTWAKAVMPLAPDEKPSFWDLWFVDLNHGWVVGDEGTILHTDTGGVTWVTQETGVPGARSASLLTPMPRGSKTEMLDLGDRTPGLTLTSVRFVDTRRGWVTGYFGFTARSLILQTQDGGVTWTVDAEIAGENLRALFVLDADHAWAIGDRVREGPQAIYRRSGKARSN